MRLKSRFISLPITAITPQDVRHVLTVIHAIRTSLETGMTVAL